MAGAESAGAILIMTDAHKKQISAQLYTLVPWNNQVLSNRFVQVTAHKALCRVWTQSKTFASIGVKLQVGG